MLRITKLDTDESILIEILDRKKESLLQAKVGIQDTWRYVLYSYNNKEKYASSLETLIRHLCTSEFRSLNIKYISGYLNTQNKSSYTMYYKDLEFCQNNKALLEQAIEEDIRREIAAIVVTKYSLIDFLRKNNIAFSMKKACISSSSKAIGYCTLHKINLSLGFVQRKQCLAKDGPKMCSNFLILRVPFWHSRLGFSMLSSTSISDRERYRKR